MGIKQKQVYRGFEQGPIRPPSEANSLLIRVTRNCPWNRCTFCSVYKRQKFSLRPVEHVIADIDAIHQVVALILQELQESGRLTAERVNQLAEQFTGEAQGIYFTAVNWLVRGEGSVFLQDANSLIIKPHDLIAILDHLKDRFPWITRITSYARSHTIDRITDDELQQVAASGLTRIHIGMETGSDTVLAQVDKGVTKAQHISAGRKVKQAGIELSEYVMPGLGGVDLSQQHALETADALNQIDADFVRLRTLTMPPGMELYKEDLFKKCTDLQVAREIRTMVDALDGISSTLKSDHFNNLLQDVEGTLPDDKTSMLAVLDEFLELPPQQQTLYQVGRRMGYFQSLDDLQSPVQRDHVESICQRLGITGENADRIIEERVRQSL
ncbi:MAG: radical SAM protein [Pseudomonadales bacterium]|nr:radical SAM protein [Pseudomonadales bacterium]MDP7145813.1 radical SAM protein [Pseudomonadales bacterium]MDP7356813.1 radical SAM protein [Pseudomonadales bacterium]HJN53367.1 radical SAM protein [Pseudomonadales bacterium]